MYIFLWEFCAALEVFCFNVRIKTSKIIFKISSRNVKFESPRAIFGEHHLNDFYNYDYKLLNFAKLRIVGNLKFSILIISFLPNIFMCAL